MRLCALIYRYDWIGYRLVGALVVAGESEEDSLRFSDVHCISVTIYAPTSSDLPTETLRECSDFDISQASPGTWSACHQSDCFGYGQTGIEH